MLLVKVGKYTINVEQVAAFIEEEEKTIVVYNIPRARPQQGNGEGGVSGLYALKLEGEASAQMQAWLRRNAESGREQPPGFSILSQEG